MIAPSPKTQAIMAAANRKSKVLTPKLDRNAGSWDSRIDQINDPTPIPKARPRPPQNRPRGTDGSSPRPASNARAKLVSSVYRAGARNQPSPGNFTRRRKPPGHHRGMVASANARSATQRQG